MIPDDSTPGFEPNWRRIRAVVTVADTGSVNRAAAALHYSQPAITRAVRELEQELGAALFERHHKGMALTWAGELMVARFRRALGYLHDAEKSLVSTGLVPGCQRLVHHLSQRQLMTLIMLARLHSEPRAAQRLGLTQPAISASLRQLESHVGTDLFLRTRRGMILTDCGEILSRQAQLAMRELSLASSDLDARQGRIRGHLVIGSLPLCSAELVPRALDHLRVRLPDVSVSVIDGTYDGLLEALRCGEIDLLIGALRTESADLVQERLFEDSLSIVTHHSHPLARRTSLDLVDVQSAEWVAPRRGTPSRSSFEREFVVAGLEPPQVSVETGNLSLVRSLLMSGQRITVASPYQFHYELESGQLCALPLMLPSTRRPIGITRRTDDMPTEALQMLCQLLRSTAKGFHPYLRMSPQAHHMLVVSQS